MKKKNLTILVLGLVVAAILLAQMLTYQVRSTEAAVVETLGQLAGEPASPGLHWRAPWPIQRVVKYDARLQNFEDTYQQVQTADRKVLLASVYVVWRIEDPIRFRGVLGDRQAEGARRLGELVGKAKQAVLGQTAMDELVSLQTSADQIRQVERLMLEQVLPQAREQYGIEVVSIGIQRLGLPEDVTATVMATMRAERQMIAQDAEARGKARAQDIVSEAQSIADQVMAFADARAEAIRAQGYQEAAEYYGVYNEHPGFAMFLQRLEFLKKVLASNAQFILDGSTYDESLGYWRRPPTGGAADAARAPSLAAPAPLAGELPAANVNPAAQLPQQ